MSHLLSFGRGTAELTSSVHNGSGKYLFAGWLVPFDGGVQESRESGGAMKPQPSGILRISLPKNKMPSFSILYQTSSHKGMSARGESMRPV
jgi:hypothetical protein